MRLDDLQDGECGYISSGCIMLSKSDDILYFTVAADHDLSIYNKRQKETFAASVWIGKKGGNYYISPDKESVEKLFTWKNKPDLDCWLQRPAMLAYNRAYPLDQKKGDFFLIPIDWKECAKHPLVKRNLLFLVSAVAMMNQLRDWHGIHSTLCQRDYNNSRLKAAMDPLAHMKFLETLGIK